MLVPRQQYSRELKIAAMREIDSGKGIAEVARMWFPILLNRDDAIVVKRQNHATANLSQMSRLRILNGCVRSLYHLVK